MNRWLNYHHLYYFRTIAQEGSIARAAVRLKLGQPTLSTQLKQLENSLGHSLFERRNRGLHLTDAGQAVLDFANEIFKLGSELLQVLDDGRFSSRVQLKIGVLESVPKHCIHQLVRSSRRAGPCSVTVAEGQGDDLFAQLQIHQLDLVLTNYPPPVSANEQVFGRIVGSSKVSVYGPPGSESFRDQFPHSLEGAEFVLPTFHSKLRHDLDQYFRSHRLHINVVVETHDTSVQKILGIDGMGLIPIPDIGTEELIDSKRLVRVGALSGIEEQYWLISAARKIENPIAATVYKNFELATPAASHRSGGSDTVL